MLRIHAALDAFKRFPVNDRRVVALYEITVELALVFYIFLGKMVQTEILLHQHIAYILFVAKQFTQMRVRPFATKVAASAHVSEFSLDSIASKPVRIIAEDHLYQRRLFRNDCKAASMDTVSCQWRSRGDALLKFLADAPLAVL